MEISSPVQIKIVGTELMPHSSCLDAIMHKKKSYLCFRNAPTHFPSSKARLIITSSSDMKKYIVEHILSMEADLREPRFVVFKGKLMLYFFKGSGSSWKFQPEQMFLSVKEDGWSEPMAVFDKGYVPWRVRQHKGKLIMSCYYSKNLYLPGGVSKVFLFESREGVHWEKIIDKPLFKSDYVTETEFIITNKDLIGVAREEGFGSYVFSGTMDNLDNIETRYTRTKHDSPVMFSYGKDIFMISRVNRSGQADRQIAFLPKCVRRFINLICYSLSRKRTGLFYLDRDKLVFRQIAFIFGKGDTAFPAVTQIGAGKFLVVNYSTPQEKGDLPWIIGQLGRTELYSQVIFFP